MIRWNKSTNEQIEHSCIHENRVFDENPLEGTEVLLME